LFKKRVLRKIFGPKKDEVTGELWLLHNEELYYLYYSGDKTKKNEMGWACGTYGGEEVPTGI
jgi:hypothetical protein